MKKRVQIALNFHLKKREEKNRKEKENIYWHHILKFFPLDLTATCVDMQQQEEEDE